MAKYIKFYSNGDPDPLKIGEIVEILQNGGIVIYPTDTVYSMGALLSKPKAIEKMARLKGIKPENARFTLLFHSLGQMSEYTKQIDTPTFKIIKRGTPGPFTFILPATHRLPKVFHKRKTIGFRVPDHKILLEILRQLDIPLVSTSIRSDDTQSFDEYVTDPELIYEKWRKHVDAVIDGGVLEKIPSTVIDLSADEPEIIREGKGDADLII